MRPGLADRLRDIVSVPRVALQDAVHDAEECRGPRLHRTAQTLGGHVVERPEGAVVIIDRRYAATRSHGRERIGDLAETLHSGREALDILHRAWPSRHQHVGHDGNGEAAASGPERRLLFLDLETTGLAGGAGTSAFLVGGAVLNGDELHVRQFLLPGFEHERALLAEVEAWLSAADTIVTFNGRSFDVPLIELRYAFHRLACALAERPHIDMLHPSRRLWKSRPVIAGPPLDDDRCNLSVLERHLAGVHRVGDVPGFEIPSRYFRFVRSGDASPLEAVLEHNRIDLLSLALVTVRAIRLIEQGPSATMHPRECLGLGRLYERARLAEHAEACYAQAATLALRVGREPDVGAESLRRLAICRRRSGRMIEAADAWAQIVGLPACPATLRQEAREALAIHHEHRSRDLRSARTFVLDALAEAPAPRWRKQAEHRLSRLERKLAVRTEGGLLAALEGAEVL